jgi:hypothetical protein
VIEGVANGHSAIVEITPIHEVDVLPSISIKVGNAEPRTKFFSVDGNAFVSFEVNELDSGLRRYVSELDRFSALWGNRWAKS